MRVMSVTSELTVKCTSSLFHMSGRCFKISTIKQCPVLHQNEDRTQHKSLVDNCLHSFRPEKSGDKPAACCLQRSVVHSLCSRLLCAKSQYFSFLLKSETASVHGVCAQRLAAGLRLTLCVSSECYLMRPSLFTGISSDLGSGDWELHVVCEHRVSALQEED